MLFNSYEYILFYIIFFVVFFCLKNIKQQILFICVSSLYFYASWSPIHVILLLGTCFIAYVSQITSIFKKYNAIFWVMLLLIVLSFFKYYNFFVTQLNYLDVNIELIDVVLPVGISFYVFQAISFIVDHQRQHIHKISLISVISYISFFPQLVAGPIVRASVFLPQLSTKRKFNKYMFRTGMFLFAMGMFKKVVIADNIGIFVDEVYDSSGETTSANHWLAFYLYAIQIYYDFCGYSEMAIGIARTLGFKFPKNFSRPYLASSITEFWRLWHISLSSWLRDYLYISLGGNRINKVRTYINLLLVMLLGGLWHGASWNFVLWGCIHGCVLSIERYFNYTHNNKLSSLIGIFITFNIVCVSWVLFRSADISSSLSFLSAMFDVSSITTITTKFTVLECFILTILFIIIEKYSKIKVFYKLRKIYFLTFVSIVYSLVFLLFGNFTDSPFIYFQF